jgi:single-strand DNA-binding protein
MVVGRLEQRSWESDGAKRSKVEVVADEVGPSLRWATAQVEKNERRGGDDGGGFAEPSRNDPPPYESSEEPF